MRTTLFIEILDEAGVRLYDNRTAYVLNDDELKIKISTYPSDTQIVLLDVLHIQSKTFVRPVQDRKILAQVIAADMGDYLFYDSEQYHFSYQENEGVIWVSWIEKKRLALLKERFNDLLSGIMALVSMPLLIAAGEKTLLKEDALSVVEHDPFTYAIFHGQTAVMRTEQASVWLQSLQEKMPNTMNLEAMFEIVFTPENIASLPNLWQSLPSQKRDKKSWPFLSWGIGLTMITLLWLVNSTLNYRHAKHLSQSMLNAQQDLLKQIFPNAKGADPYGRLSADYQRLINTEDKIKLKQLDEALAGKKVSLASLSIDLNNKLIRLEGNISEVLQQSLTQKGFIVTPIKNSDLVEETEGVILSW